MRTLGEGFKKSENFADIISGSSLTFGAPRLFLIYINVYLGSNLALNGRLTATPKMVK